MSERHTDRPACHTRAECRGRRAAAQRKSYAKHRERRIAEVVRWRENNAERVRKYDREYYAKNRDRKRESAREKLARDRAAQRTAADRITDSYIANVWKMSVADVPPALLDAQRVHLQLQRALRKKTK